MYTIIPVSFNCHPIVYLVLQKINIKYNKNQMLARQQCIFFWKDIFWKIVYNYFSDGQQLELTHVVLLPFR